PTDRAPVVTLALDERVHEREQRRPGEAHANDVEAVRPARTYVRNDEERADERDDPDRHVDEEDPAPVEVGDDEASKGRPGDGRNADDRAPEPECRAHALAREDRSQDRERLRSEKDRKSVV